MLALVSATLSFSADSFDLLVVWADVVNFSSLFAFVFSSAEEALFDVFGISFLGLLVSCNYDQSG